MSKTLAKKLKNIVDIWEEADARIEEQRLIQKGALDAGKENDGIEPAVVRKILARRKKLAKDPAETTRLEDLMVDYQFLLGEGREADARPWTQADDEVSRVMALTNTDKPPKIEAIKKALGCSQGKAHKLRTMAATRLAKKSSSSRDDDEHEHLKPEKGEREEASQVGGPDTSAVVGSTANAPSGDPEREARSPTNSDAAPQPTGMGLQTPQSVPDGGVGADTNSVRADASDCEARDAAGRLPGVQGESDAPLDIRVPEADGRSDREDGPRASGGEGLQRHSGCGAAGGAGQDVRDPGAPLECDVGERGNHAAAGRDSSDLVAPNPEVARAAPPESLDARGEATNPDGLDIPSFLRRPRERVMA